METGIDIVEVERVKKAVLNNQNFLTKYFTQNEITYFNQKGENKYQSIAANFAGKEAFSKALRTGIRGFSLKEVEILRDNLGAPYINLFGKAKEISKGKRFSISLSHTKENAIAICIAMEG
ncbi:MAG: holo-ACP synthase [Oscillospiraceae bacterium]